MKMTDEEWLDWVCEALDYDFCFVHRIKIIALEHIVYGKNKKDSR